MQRAAAGDILRALGIPLHDPSRGVRTLSGGQRQLLAVARAMSWKPRLLILDEPTASLGVTEAAQVEGLITSLRLQGTTILLVSHDVEQMFRLADRIVVLRHGRVAGDVRPDSGHPDEVTALVSGQPVDSSARRQLTRLHGLADRLASADPSSSLSLILSALGAALGTERLCIHLLSARTTLVCAASLGLPPPLLAAWSRLGYGPAGGPVGLAAATAEVVVDDNVRASAAGRRSVIWPGRPRSSSSWAVPVLGPSGLIGVITVFRQVTGRPQRDELDLVSVYAGYAASAVERDRLLDQVTARNRVLETIGRCWRRWRPIPVPEGLGVALRALRRGLQADEVALLSRPPDGAPRSRAHAGSRRRAGCPGRWPTPRPGRSPLAHHDGRARSTDGERQLSVAFPAPGGPGGPGRQLGKPVGHRGRGGADGGRGPLPAAGPGTGGGSGGARGSGHAAPVTGTPAELPVPAEPRAAHPAHRNPRLRDQPAADRRDLGRRLAAPVPGPDLRRVGAAGTARGRPARLLRHRVGDPAAAATTGATSRSCSEAAIACLPQPGASMVEVTCHPALPTVWADHDRLEQVFVNLLDNAIRHNPPGTRVSVTAEPGRGGEVVIGVATTAPGCRRT